MIKIKNKSNRKDKKNERKCVNNVDYLKNGS